MRVVSRLRNVVGTVVNRDDAVEQGYDDETQDAQGYIIQGIIHRLRRSQLLDREKWLIDRSDRSDGLRQGDRPHRGAG